MCSIIPEASNIHTVIVMFQHELFIHSIAVLPCLAHHCALFTFVYILPSKLQMVSYLLNSIFKLKEQTICNVYSIIPEHGTFNPANVLQYCAVHVVTQLTCKNARECFGNRVAILDYFNLDTDFW